MDAACVNEPSPHTEQIDDTVDVTFDLSVGSELMVHEQDTESESPQSDKDRTDG